MAITGWKCKCGYNNDKSSTVCGDCGKSKPSSSIWKIVIAGTVVLIIALAIAISYMIKLPEKKYKLAINKCVESKDQICKEADKVAKIYRIPDEKIKKWINEVKPSTSQKPPSQDETKTTTKESGTKEDFSVSEIEVNQSLNLGIMHIAAAKANLKNKKLFDESIDNAIKEFSIAIEKASDQPVMLSKAYEQRGAAYLVQKKFNKALDDLKKASELQPKSPSIFYNLSCLYSVTKAVDLGLDALDKALSNGFNNYEALKNDTDLTNLRKSPEFKKILEKHNIWLTL